MHTNALKVFVHSILHIERTQLIIILVLFAVIVILYLKNHFSTKYRKFTSISFENGKVHENNKSDHIAVRKAKCLIDHKHMLNALHDASDKCDDKIYAIQCIDLVAYCPYLMNVQSEPYGLTPFHRVCLRGQTCIIEYMLSKGANPLLTTKTGENSLCMAIYYFLKNPLNDDFTCLDILYKAGCDFSLNDKWYKTILETVTHNNNKKLAEWLMLHARSSKANVFTRCVSVPSMSDKRNNYRNIL